MDQLFPNYVEASTKEALRDELARISIEKGGTVNFYSQYFDPITKTHVAWYHDKPENILSAKYKKAKALNEKRS